MESASFNYMYALHHVFYREIWSQRVCGLPILHWQSAGSTQSDGEGGGVARHDPALAGKGA
mgnify:CR=1 FL=1